MKNTIKHRKQTFTSSTFSRKPSVVGALFLALMLAFSFSSCEMMNDLEEMDKDHDHPENEAKLFVAELQPLNNSGVTGKATFKYEKGGQFLAEVHAEGLVPDMMHPQHIHGFEDNEQDAVCPPESAAGDDGLLTLEDGLPFYGPILVPLDQNLVPLEAEEFPHANHAGKVDYRQLTELHSLVTALDERLPGHQAHDNLNLPHRVVVLHGAYVKGGQIVSPGTEGAEYDPTLPVACGEIREAGGHHEHGDGGGH